MPRTQRCASLLEHSCSSMASIVFDSPRHRPFEMHVDLSVACSTNQNTHSYIRCTAGLALPGLQISHHHHQVSFHDHIQSSAILSNGVSLRRISSSPAVTLRQAASRHQGLLYHYGLAPLAASSEDDVPEAFKQRARLALVSATTIIPEWLRQP
jgi:hypothetical protein